VFFEAYKAFSEMGGPESVESGYSSRPVRGGSGV